MRTPYWVALGIAGLVVAVWLVRVLLVVLMTSTVTICPQCGSTEIKRSADSGFTDRMFHYFGCKPYRCLLCSRRFYRSEAAR